MNCCDALTLVCDYSLGVVAVAVFGLIGVVGLPEPLPVESEIKHEKNLESLFKRTKHTAQAKIFDKEKNAKKSESETFNS